MGGSQKLSGWRRVANGMWRAPEDPQIYGVLEIDASPMLPLVEGFRALGHKVTPTHFVGRAIALTLREVPELNVRLRGDRAYPRQSADVFFITSVARGTDLSGVKIERVDHKTVLEVARELGERAAAAKAGRDPDLAKSKRAMDALPMPLLRIALRAAKWLVGDRDMDLPALGLKRSPFGSAAITNVGTFGLPLGFAPISWMYNVPLLVLVGTIVDKPVAIDGQVVVRPILPVTATIDHRYVDGAHLARAMKAFRGYLESPATFEPEAARLVAAARAPS